MEVQLLSSAPNQELALTNILIPTIVDGVKSFVVLVIFCFFLIGIILAPPAVFSYNFQGLTGVDDGHGHQGEESSVDWDPGFLTEIAALQAAVVRSMQEYDGYIIFRDISGKVIKYDGNKEIDKKFFVGSGTIIPVSNKCSSEDTTRHVVVSGLLDRTKQNHSQRKVRRIFWTENKETYQLREFVGSVAGVGWNCMGLTGEPFWVPDTGKDDKAGVEELKKLMGTDQNYIQDYLKRSAHLRYPGIDADQSEGIFFDYGAGRWGKYLTDASDFVLTNCKCVEKKEDNEKK